MALDSRGVKSVIAFWVGLVALGWFIWMFGWPGVLAVVGVVFVVSVSTAVYDISIDDGPDW